MESSPTVEASSGPDTRPGHTGHINEHLRARESRRASAKTTPMPRTEALGTRHLCPPAGHKSAFDPRARWRRPPLSGPVDLESRDVDAAILKIDSTSRRCILLRVSTRP
ncbi:hypothetical protein MAA_11337 [Metarhizium robertsii ARSEF 23]|uniref:Uncharacterized protein n=1 Tax=Metarhizium robertsii (strain ARSEF 23 / ATCC MYA-3075) TaxID=655844 RepID=A0A0B2X859_METRA|nr:uncharacterized protein MAA_11337 [Metarhizium robertsii ARSEF 23]KHO11068.1 hypothetical protein MAA_11337 [Metarhizium robertsii ARSEF 23]